MDDVQNINIYNQVSFNSLSFRLQRLISPARQKHIYLNIDEYNFACSIVGV
jgi:hypothetical protein